MAAPEASAEASAGNEKQKEFNRELEQLGKNGEDAESSCKEVFQFIGYHLASKDLNKLADYLKTKYLLTLILNGTQILQSGAVVLAESLKNNTFLQLLDLSNNPLADNGVTALCGVFKYNQTLEELILQKCSFTADGAASIGEMLSKNKTLTVLDVSRNAISDDGVRDICHGIIETTVGDASQLMRIDMKGCFMGDEGAKHIGSIIGTVATLRDVDLSNNNIGENGAKFLAHGLLRNNIAQIEGEETEFSLDGLETLNLDYNELTDAGVIALARVLPANHTLKNLSLKGVGMKKEGLEVLCANIAETNIMEKLFIGENQIEKDTVSEPITKMLNSMDALNELSISGIHLSEEDVKTIGEFLSTNNQCRLAKLYMSDCDIDDDGAGYIAQGIKFNTDLKVLDVTSNSFKARGARLFAKTFERAKSLDEFHITGASRIGAEGENHLARTLRYNQRLVIKGSASELDYMSDFVHKGKAFKTNPETGEIEDWSDEAWVVVKRGAGAIIGTVINLLDEDDFKIFKEEICSEKRNVVNQTMFEYVLRHSEAPVIDTVTTFLNKCGMDWDQECGSRASKSLASTLDKSDDAIYRMVADKYCKDPRVKSLAMESELYLGRYKKTTGQPTYKTKEAKRFLATDLGAEGGVEKVFVQEYTDDDDFQREVLAREDMRNQLKAGGPFAIYDFVLRERCVHEESLVISYNRSVHDLRHSIENLGVCAGYDIKQTVFLARRAAETLGAVNNLGRIHGDFRPRNFYMVAKERIGDDPRGRGKKVLPPKWVLFDMCKSVPHGTKVLLREDSAYLPPEVARVTFNTKMHEKQLPLANEKMDVWCFGVVLYQLLTGQHLFHMETPTDKLYRRNERSELMNWICLDEKRQSLVLHRANEAKWPNPTMFKKILETAKDLVVWCLQGNPHNRPKFNDILSHPFFDYRKMVRLQDVDLLLGWYEAMGLKKADSSSKNNRTHAHIINTSPKECRDVTRSLKGYYRAAGCRVTTDYDDWSRNIDKRKELTDKAQCLLVLMTKDVFFNPKLLQYFIWALDCPETSSIVFLDVSTANTGAEKFDFEQFELEWHKGKSKKMEALVESLHPMPDFLNLETLDVHIKKKKSKSGLKQLLQEKVYPEIERLYERMMPYRTRAFQGQAMIDEILIRSGFYPIGQTRSLDLLPAKKKEEEEKTNVLILWNEESEDKKLREDVMKLRQKMLGLKKGNCKVSVIGTPGEVYNFFDRTEEGELKSEGSTVIICMASKGFYDAYKGTLIELNEAKGAVSLIPIAYNEWNPASTEALNEISNSGITATSFLEGIKNPNSYIPLPHARKGLEYEMNASLSYILDEASKRLAVSERNEKKQEDQAYAQYTSNILNTAY
eukprot:CAMPEP_0204825456 /NCGR_PEP_ID=MMETSP1346-20131115/3341_1 /ASSEMBLY_ACC=CAM_ASM_000771 /TAXON_ID=215587 /ORGANISM="Aplanochytrium stocchinoi, Strain GSBS06" /LENGTH=1358 /DNA_ID=CAMNT_0051953099 /DNA_START=53 /DNA_END=4129 /DNA_ORIENTATION=-